MPLDDEDTVQLCRLGLFQNMEPKDLMFLVRVSHTVIAGPGTEVISQNSIGDFFYIVVDGLLRVKIHVNGKVVIPAYLSHGQFAGEMAIMQQTRRGATVEAARETRLVRVPGFTFRRIMSKPENRVFLEKKMALSQRSNTRLATAASRGGGAARPPAAGRTPALARG